MPAASESDSASPVCEHLDGHEGHRRAGTSGRTTEGWNNDWNGSFISAAATHGIGDSGARPFELQARVLLRPRC